MKNGYYWARFYTKDENWVVLVVSNGVVYNVGPAGIYDFGAVEEFMERFPDIELVEIVEPKEKELQLIVDVLRTSFHTEVGRIEKQGNVTYAIINESEKEAFLDSVAQFYRNRAEELLFERK